MNFFSISRFLSFSFWITFTYTLQMFTINRLLLDFKHSNSLSLDKWILLCMHITKNPSFSRFLLSCTVYVFHFNGPNVVLRLSSKQSICSEKIFWSTINSNEILMKNNQLRSNFASNFFSVKTDKNISVCSLKEKNFNFRWLVRGSLWMECAIEEPERESIFS